MKKLFILHLFILSTLQLFAQLDTIHWLPPMHARVDWGPQYLVLSTPETTPFPVTLRDGSGNLITTVNISNTTPYKHDIGSANSTFAFVTESDLHKPLQNRGIVVDGKKKFYAYFRAHSNNQAQASDLTCKGRAAIGKTFRIGHLLQEIDNNAVRSNFLMQKTFQPMLCMMVGMVLLKEKKWMVACMYFTPKWKYCQAERRSSKEISRCFIDQSKIYNTNLVCSIYEDNVLFNSTLSVPQSAFCTTTNEH